MCMSVDKEAIIKATGRVNIILSYGDVLITPDTMQAGSKPTGTAPKNGHRRCRVGKLFN